MMNFSRFSKISDISPSQITSWNEKIFLTFDMDWAHDAVIEDTLNLVREAGVASTWFVTHKSSLLNELGSDGNIELGIHPNFNECLSGERILKSEKIISDCLELAPFSKTVRSHSLTQSERLVDQFSAAGITHMYNMFIPYGSGINAIPFSLWGGMVMVPHSWQDNVALKMKVDFPEFHKNISGCNVLDFHPIHIFLNTENLDRYEKTRSFHQKPNELIKHRFQGYGTRSRLIDLIKYARSA